MSKCYELMRNWDISIAMLNKAISIRPTEKDKIQLSLLYALQKNYHKTIEILSGILNGNLEKENIMLYLASAHFKNNDIQKSIELLQQLLELYPENALAHFLIGVGLYFQDDVELSEKHINLSIDNAESSMLKNLNRYFLKYLKQ